MASRLLTSVYAGRSAPGYHQRPPDPPRKAGDRCQLRMGRDPGVRRRLACGHAETREPLNSLSVAGPIQRKKRRASSRRPRSRREAETLEWIGSPQPCTGIAAGRGRPFAGTRRISPRPWSRPRARGSVVVIALLLALLAEAPSGGADRFANLLRVLRFGPPNASTTASQNCRPRHR